MCRQQQSRGCPVGSGSSLTEEVGESVGLDCREGKGIITCSTGNNACHVVREREGVVTGTTKDGGTIAQSTPK